MLRLFGLLLGVLVLASCGGGGGASSPAGGSPPPTPTTLTFSASIIDPAAIRWITPMGNLNPPAHPLPTDHIYFYFANPDAGESPVTLRTAFFAPADGTITAIFQNMPGQPDVKLFIQATSDISYTLDHLIPDTPPVVGAQVRAGQRLGTTGSVFAVDLGVIDARTTLAFVNPSRYANSDTLHARAPLPFFTEPLKTQLYAKVQRLGTEKDGRIDYDVAGRLAGNWFSDYGTVPLSFAYDTYDPGQVRISLPGVLTLAGVMAIDPGDPLPRDVSAVSGKVRFTLTPSRTGLPFTASATGTLLVQMLDDTHLRVETFPLGDPAADFTGNARDFGR